MRRAAAVLLLPALPCAAFAWWGTFTAAGSSHFDEMAGMIPIFAGVASAVLLLSSAVAGFLGTRS
jgi:hypothetical protein